MYAHATPDVAYECNHESTWIQSAICVDEYDILLNMAGWGQGFRPGRGRGSQAFRRYMLSRGPSIVASGANAVSLMDAWRHESAREPGHGLPVTPVGIRPAHRNTRAHGGTLAEARKSNSAELRKSVQVLLSVSPCCQWPGGGIHTAYHGATFSHTLSPWLALGSRPGLVLIHGASSQKGPTGHLLGPTGHIYEYRYTVLH
jgi:hypothetical protein